jgi:hypothetical protein
MFFKAGHVIKSFFHNHSFGIECLI